jgi:hypothetical protein
MTITIILISIILWFIIGYKSFVYWWTKDWDYTSNEVSMAVMASIGGPISFFIGKAIHGGITIHTDIGDTTKVIKPKRK